MNTSKYISGKETPLKWLFRIGSGDSIDMKKVSANKDLNQEVPVVGGNGVMGYTEFSNTIADTLIVGRVGAHCGNIHYIKEKSWITDNALRIKLTDDQLDKNFLKYALIALGLNQFANRNAQPLITGETVKSKSILLTTLEEQTLIACFLDQKTSQIDRLIEQKEKLLKLLAEKRTAIITQAVTKGLDSSVEMKGSGIDWLGEIHKDWGIKKLKFLASSNDEKLGEKEEPDLELKYVEIGNVDLIGGITLIEELNFEDAPSRARRIARKGDLIISTVRTYLKAIAFIKENIENLTVSTGFAVMRSLDESVFLPKYLGYCAQDQRFIEKIVCESVGVSYPAISPWKITEISVVYPGIFEQAMIVEFLDKKLKQLDIVKSEIESSIEKLKEYREALITSAVTGQIDVRKEVSHG